MLPLVLSIKEFLANEEAQCYPEPGMKEDTSQVPASTVSSLVAFFFQTGTSPTENVSSGPQGSAINYFCSVLKQALSLTLD